MIHNLPVYTDAPRARTLSVDLTDRIGPIKNIFLRRATGLSGDFPGSLESQLPER